MASYIDADYDKLEGDLLTVAEKVKLCREMMEARLPLEDGLGDVVGFLEACRDRMPDLIDAGAQGQMSEVLFAKALACNDAVQRTLDAERSGGSISIDDGLESLMGAVEASKISKETAEDDLLDIGGASMTGKTQDPGKKKARSRVNQTFTLKEPINSEDGNTFVSPFHTGSEESSPAHSSKQEDDFDRFLKDINSN